MTKRTVDISVWTCNKCKQECTSVELPKGWTERSEERGPCGLTDFFYTEHLHFCKKCSKKEAKE